MPNDEIEVLFKTDKYMETLGGVSLVRWPEGLVLWVGGMIVYKSWERPNRS